MRTRPAVYSQTTTPFAPILVGIDGTSISWDALAWAEDEFASRPALGPSRFVLCRSYHRDAAGARLPNPPDMGWLDLVDPGFARRAGEVRDRLGFDDVAVHVRAGGIAEHLIGLATPDSTVVIAAPDRDVPAVLRVAEHAAGIVVAVRPTMPPVDVTAGPFAGHVIVGVDGSNASQAAVRFAFDYGARHKLPVAAVHANAVDPSGAWLDSGAPQVHLMPYVFDLDLLDAAIQDAHDTHPEVHVRRFLLRRRAADALVGASAGAVLLVVGDRGRGPVARRMLGSVSRHVVRHAHCSVAVAHHPTPAGPRARGLSALRLASTRPQAENEGIPARRTP